MSDFKAKNLTYDKSQPAFLQRLRAEYSGDRNNVQFARPNKSRLKTGDADEDEPTMVDETGEGVSKEEYEEMLRKAQAGEEGVSENAEVDENMGSNARVDETREKQRVAKVGGSKKRKVGKVIGYHDDIDKSNETVGSAERKQSDEKKEAVTPQASKPKKKVKKIKLSFDEPED